MKVMEKKNYKNGKNNEKQKFQKKKMSIYVSPLGEVSSTTENFVRLNSL